MYNNEGLIVSKILGGLLLGAPISAGISGVCNTVNTFKHLPKATYTAYKTIWKSKKLGPNLKVLLSALVPFGVVLTPPIVLLGSTIFGLGHGFWTAIDKGSYNKVPRESWELVKRLDNTIKENLDECLTGNDEELNDEYFDIRILEAIRGLLCALIFAPIEAVGVVLALIHKWFPVVFRLYKHLWHTDGTIVNFIFNIALALLITVAALLSIPLAPLCAALFSIGDMSYQGYKFGFAEAGKRCFNHIKDFHSLLTDMAKS
jgi:hypothetical protein